MPKSEKLEKVNCLSRSWAKKLKKRARVKQRQSTKNALRSQSL